MRLLVVEDEPKLNKGIVKGLKTRGFAVDFAYEGLAGENLARQNTYDLIIMDIMMPIRDGLTVCRNLRSSGIQTPVLMLTAKDAVEDRVAGLDSGADDYLIKPFAFEELAARVRSLLRRPPAALSDQIELEGLTLDTKAGRACVGSKEISLTSREFSLLEYLMRNRGALLTRDAILEHVWDAFYDSRSNVIDVHLKNLRQKLPKKYAERIKTIRGKGYRLD